MPVKTTAVAEAMALDILPEDASDGAFAAECKRIRSWLNNIARGHGRKAPEVLACKVPEVKVVHWRKAAPQE